MRTPNYCKLQLNDDKEKKFAILLKENPKSIRRLYSKTENHKEFISEGFVYFADHLYLCDIINFETTSSFQKDHTDSPNDIAKMTDCLAINPVLICHISAFALLQSMQEALHVLIEYLDDIDPLLNKDREI